MPTDKEIEAAAEAIILINNNTIGLKFSELTKAMAKAALEAAEAVGKEEQRSVAIAWRCKDYADGWIIYHDKIAAIKYQEATGCAMQGLYLKTTPDPKS